MDCSMWGFTVHHQLLELAPTHVHLVSDPIQSSHSLLSHSVDWSNLAFVHALEKEMATHSSILAWRIPGTEEPGGLPSTGSHRIRHDRSNLAAAAASLETMPPSYNKVKIQVTCPWALYACVRVEWIDAGSFRSRHHIILAPWSSQGTKILCVRCSVQITLMPALWLQIYWITNSGEKATGPVFSWIPLTDIMYICLEWAASKVYYMFTIHSFTCWGYFCAR